MNNKNNKTKIKVLHLGNSLNQKIKIDKSPKKNIIESYNSKDYNVNNNKYEYYPNKKLNLEISSTFEKNNNLSLFSLLSSNTNQEERLINKSLRTTRETESNQNSSKEKKIFHGKMKLKINIDDKEKKKQKAKNFVNKSNNININKELDKFKFKIDNLLKIIENFENNFIKSEKPKKIKEEFNKIISNKKYFQIDNKTNKIKSKSNSKNIKNIIVNKENSQLYKIKNIFNSMNDINSKRHEKILIKTQNSNNNTNTFNRRLKYSLLLNENSNKKAKTKRIIKEKKINYDNNKNIKTQYYPSKSIEMNGKKNFKKDKEKNKKIKNIYTNSNYNKTPKINKIKSKNK